MEEALTDRQAFLNKAVAATITDDPDVLEHIMKGLAERAKTDDRSAAIFLEFAGIKAPKQTDVKVKQEPMTPEEAQAILEELGGHGVIEDDSDGH